MKSKREWYREIEKVKEKGIERGGDNKTVKNKIRGGVVEGRDWESEKESVRERPGEKKKR